MRLVETHSTFSLVIFGDYTLFQYFPHHYFVFFLPISDTSKNSDICRHRCAVHQELKEDNQIKYL